jgi:uncharacterized protein (UPF0261 family)
MEKSTICIIVSLDTKLNEARYIKNRIEEYGLRTIIIDISARQELAYESLRDLEPIISCSKVAKIGGYDFKEITRLPRSEALERMAIGLKNTIKSLYNERKIDGVLAIGGADGAIVASNAMKELPLGIPKVIVSPIFQGSTKFEPFVGTKDMVLIHSVVDIAGVNIISRIIFDNAVAAIVGAVTMGSKTWREPPKVNSIAITMYGNTTPGVMKAKSMLEKENFEVVIFHPNGTGGRAMEELIRQGYFAGVLDYTPHEIVDELFGGLHSAGPQRLEAAGEIGIPQVIVPGCLDFILMGSLESLPKEIKEKRQVYKFNPMYTLVKITEEEATIVAEYLASKLNKAKGHCAIVYPLKGLSMYDREGDLFYNPKITLMLLNTLKSKLRSDIPVIEVNAHVNDLETAKIAAGMLLNMIKGKFSPLSF